MRANQDQIEYKEFLLKVGNGILQTFDDYREIIKVPESMAIPENQSIIDTVFGSRIIPGDTSVYNRCILTPKNDARLVFLFY